MVSENAQKTLLVVTSIILFPLTPGLQIMTYPSLIILMIKSRCKLIILFILTFLSNCAAQESTNYLLPIPTSSFLFIWFLFLWNLSSLTSYCFKSWNRGGGSKSTQRCYCSTILTNVNKFYKIHIYIFTYCSMVKKNL